MGAVIGIGAAALLVGVLLGILGFWLRGRFTGTDARERAAAIIEAARAEREQLVRGAELDTKAQQLRMQQEHEREAQALREELGQHESKLRQRETNVERKNELLDKRDRELRKRESQIEQEQRDSAQAHSNAQQRLAEALAELERVAALSPEQARQQIIAEVEQQARKEAATKVLRIESEAREQARERATRIIASTIQRLAGGFVAEKTVSVVELPSDDMKGRIIGREGRNIRAIESATGVDVIIDDTPEVVVLSGFDPMRREIARLSLERLIADGRIHPARIEEIVEQVRHEMDEVCQRHGEQATFDLGLAGLHPELVKLVGMLKFRVVNGQNVWNHAVETASIAGLIASELGLKSQAAKRAGLLHDIGKAVDHETEGNHSEVGAEQARRLGERADVVEAIGHHHSDSPPSLLAVIVQAADTLSKARPGARREMLASYIKRLEDLERAAKSFKGVEQAYAIQSGRELRVIVNFEQIDDQEALLLSGDIARRIEDELTYTSEVKVTVIREARAIEIAH